MPEHLRAMVVILAVATAAFSFARGPLCHSIFDRAAYTRDCCLWFAVTLAAFLSHDFWIFLVLAGGILLIWGPSSANPLATYCLLLFAAPPFQIKLSGLGLIEDLFTINYYRLLALTILLPTALKLMMEGRGSRARPTDYCVLALLSWMAILRLVNDTPTGTARGIFYLFIDCWLPYYVASRVPTTLRQLQQVAGALCVSAVIVSVLAAFESQRSWLLYASLGRPWGMFEQMPMYLNRGDNPTGVLRSLVSLGHPIVLGYTLVVALLMTCGIHTALRPSSKRSMAYLAISAGFVASMSRGPWVGAAVGLVAFLAVGRNAMRRLVALVALGGLVIVALLLSPLADRAIAVLPFVGTVDSGNIDYRSRLIEVSLALIARNPLAGDFNFMSDPSLEEMRQGEGIIDVVNTYLQFALPFGLVGLVLFVSIFLSGFGSVWRIRRAIADPEAERFGRALCACVVGVLVTISTVSSIFAIPTIYWLLAGLCVGYARVFDVQRRADPVRSNAVRISPA